MTFDEWLECEAFIASNWQNAKRQGRDEVRLRHLVVADLDRDRGLAELVTMLRSGEWEFPPNPGQIYAAAARSGKGPSPAPGTVLALLNQAASRFGASPYAPAEKQRATEAAAIRWLSERSEHAARFVVEHGWRQFCREGLHDPEFGGAVRQRLERSIAGSTAGLDRERREGRELPLVSDHVQRLESGQDTPSGLRRLGGGVEAFGLTAPQQLEADNDQRRAA